MLDDQHYIKQHDPQDALGIASTQWQQYQHTFDVTWEPAREIFDVVVTGMGGSGLAAKVIKSWPGLSVPFEIVQSYDWPEHITSSTLLICSSYSGNTEETLAILDRALDKDYPEELQPMIVIVASGGALADRAKEHNLPLVQMPTGYQPRMTLGYQLRALAEALYKAHLVDGALEQLGPAGEWLKIELEAWLPGVSTIKNKAKQIAQELIGKSIVVYSGPALFPAAYKWKISFNENAKHIAWCNQLPEFNHNEMLGWTEQPVQKPYAIIDLRSNLEHPRVQKRFEVTERLLSGKRPAPIIIKPEGKTLLEQLVWTIALGDFVSLYVAILNGINPTPVELIEKFKKALD